MFRCAQSAVERVTRNYVLITMNGIVRALDRTKFEFIRKCHLLCYAHILKKIARNRHPKSFQCNICGLHTKALLFDICNRETPSCSHCGSTLRMRSVIHLLSQELFGESMPLPDFPRDKNVVGMGMSDREEYAHILAEKFSYTNTYYHKNPRFDITSIDSLLRNKFDFIISCEVFEHVMPPTQKAFDNLKYILKDKGIVILTVPYILFANTWDHFPELNEFEIIDSRTGKKLINITTSGKRQEFSELSFHGGQGATLELRIFTKTSLKKALQSGGFGRIKFSKCDVPQYGIMWPVSWSLPITAG